jgi:glycosyltransferase involved in cell wall biosynthesis
MTENRRVLFMLPNLPRPKVSVAGIARGDEALSGSHSSALLVVDALAGRGWPVGLFVWSGGVLRDGAARQFSVLSDALTWVGSGRIVFCSWGNPDLLQKVVGLHHDVWEWTQVDVPDLSLRLLESGALQGLLVVSDHARLPLLHSRAHRRVGRVYNPLNPAFAAPPETGSSRYESRNVVFAGFLGESKGAHKVLQLWPHVREALPDPTLTIAGSRRLYDDTRGLGPLGVAAPEFERRYLQPLIRRFGSLERVGVRLAGLLPPRELRGLYQRSSLGFVNFNWTEYTETFCCVATEMLAAGLPVFSFSAGALPETIGRSGGAVLHPRPSLEEGAMVVKELLEHPGALGRLGASGRQYVTETYALRHTTEHWEGLLSTDSTRLEELSGPWMGDRGMRYRVERATGLLGVGAVVEWSRAARRVLGRGP